MTTFLHLLCLQQVQKLPLRPRCALHVIGAGWQLRILLGILFQPFLQLSTAALSPLLLSGQSHPHPLLLRLLTSLVDITRGALRQFQKGLQLAAGSDELDSHLARLVGLEPAARVGHYLHKGVLRVELGSVVQRRVGLQAVDSCIDALGGAQHQPQSPRCGPEYLRRHMQV